MIEFTEWERDFLIEGLDDWVGLWRFARVGRDERPDATADEIRELTLPMVERLVTGELMRPGRLTDDAPGFVPWREEGEEAVARIDREWRALGRDPNIPDICWFETRSLEIGWRAGFFKPDRKSRPSAVLCRRAPAAPARAPWSFTVNE